MTVLDDRTRLGPNDFVSFRVVEDLAANPTPVFLTPPSGLGEVTPVPEQEHAEAVSRSRPSPPRKEAPPITTATIASSSRPKPAVGAAAPSRPSMTSIPAAVKQPMTRRMPIRVLPSLTPAWRSMRGSLPSA
jgi:hypothetical protein